MRRGWFVEGLSGAQFAMPGGVDGLRAATAEEPLVLSALDPANAWGALLPWPESPGTASPRRATGSVVVLHGGKPLLWLPRAGKSMVTFPAARESERLAQGLLLLKARLSRFFDRSLVVAQVDGAPATETPLVETLLAGGFQIEDGRLRLVDF